MMQMLIEIYDKYASQFYRTFIEDDRWKFFAKGLGNTLTITVVAVFVGLLLGIIVAAIRSSHDKNIASMRPSAGRTILKIANTIANIYLTVIRGTPVVVQLLIMYFIIMASTRNGVIVACITFGINSGAYVAEIIRGGIMAIDNGQFEAGRSLGFNYIQTMRYIIIPQVIKAVLPALANEFIALLKETSVSGYVAIMDITKAGDIVRGVTYIAFFPLISVALIYLILVMFFTWLVGKLEKRLRRDAH